MVSPDSHLSATPVKLLVFSIVANNQENRQSIIKFNIDWYQAIFFQENVLTRDGAKTIPRTFMLFVSMEPIDLFALTLTEFDRNSWTALNSHTYKDQHPFCKITFFAKISGRKKGNYLED